MKVYGVTGGIGMGKSTTAIFLRGQGFPVIDTDVLARQVVEPHQPALAEIQAVFGKDIVNEDGHLRRHELGQQVFANADARLKLESILHPRIRAIWREQIEAWNRDGIAVGIVVIPLLFETNAEACFSSTLCVACSAAMQQKRLLARGWPPEHIRQRIESQWPAEKKMTLADFVVWTEAGLEVHAEQLNRIIASDQGR